MAALIVQPKPAPIELPPAQVVKLTATARSKGADSVLVHLAPAPGCVVTVLWFES
jgi:hypothetical protein